MPCLIQKTADGSLVKQWNVTDKPFSVGRGENADARLDDKQMSRIHFVIAPKADGHVLADCKSSNGTFVNGKLVEGEIALKPDDRIRAGQTHFVFETGVSTMIRQLEKDGPGYSTYLRDLSQEKKKS